MSFNPAKGHSALRRFRSSEPNASYFLTLCTDGKRVGLTQPAISSKIWRELYTLDFDQTWQLRTAVIMPNHLHVFITLGDLLPLDRAIQRLKAKISSCLKQHGLAWERTFFDRKLRKIDSLLPIFLYIYLNPYRAKLLSHTERWSDYLCCSEDWAWFQSCLTQDLPTPEWLSEM